MNTLPPTPVTLLPDVAFDSPENYQYLEAVGMSEIQVPLKWRQHLLPSFVDTFVDLKDPKAKGIHMSRLFKIVQETLPEKKWSAATADLIMDQFLKSHEGLSNQAELKVSTQIMLERKSLVSSLKGWRNFPVKWLIRKNQQGTRYYLQTQVVYSSTCPASAALSRQVQQTEFFKKFTGDQVSRNEVFAWLGSAEGWPATPHAQRSELQVVAEVTPETFDSADELIDGLEQVLKTPVQTVVKREDEQQFAKLNAQNLMYCEDSGRKVLHFLSKLANVKDFYFEARHYESLHPHNAVSHGSAGQSLKSFI